MEDRPRQRWRWRRRRRIEPQDLASFSPLEVVKHATEPLWARKLWRESFEDYDEDFMGQTVSVFLAGSTHGIINLQFDTRTEEVRDFGAIFPPQFLELSSYKKEAELYKTELLRVKEEQRSEEALKQEQRIASTAYLEESIALAEPIALELLAWLYYDGELSLQDVLNAYDDSVNAFECIARLHFIGAVRFDKGKLSFTSLGERILQEFNLVEDIKDK